MNARLQDKILCNVKKDPDNQCWIWCGQISNSGHGRIMVKDEDNSTRMDSARNVSYLAFVDAIPAGFLTRQRCNNRLCVNPEHLELFDPEAARR